MCCTTATCKTHSYDSIQIQGKILADPELGTSRSSLTRSSALQVSLSCLTCSCWRELVSVPICCVCWVCLLWTSCNELPIWAVDWPPEKRNTSHAGVNYLISGQIEIDIDALITFSVVNVQHHLVLIVDFSAFENSSKHEDSLTKTS